MNHNSQLDQPVQPVIAIVDDDDAVRSATGQLCEAYDYATRLYVSAEEFLAACQGTIFDCLVLDIQLPGMSGLELQAELIRQQMHIPVVVVTGGHDPTVRDRALAQGAVAFLHKPADGARMLDRIQFALSSGC